MSIAWLAARSSANTPGAVAERAAHERSQIAAKRANCEYSSIQYVTSSSPKTPNAADQTGRRRYSVDGDQLARTFWASSPLRPGPMSNSTFWPSSRDLYPSPAMLE